MLTRFCSTSEIRNVTENFSKFSFREKNLTIRVVWRVCWSVFKKVPKNKLFRLYQRYFKEFLKLNYKKLQQRKIRDICASLALIQQISILFISSSNSQITLGKELSYCVPPQNMTFGSLQRKLWQLPCWEKMQLSQNYC